MSILVVADIKNKKINPATLEIITAAKKIAQVKNIPIHVLIPFKNVMSDRNWIMGFDITIIDLDIENYSADVLLASISQLAKSINAHYIIGLDTPFTIDYLPSLTLQYNAPCITKIHAIDIDNLITVTRWSYNGKLEQHIVINVEPVILSILPGSFEPHLINDDEKKDIKIIKTDADIKNCCEFLLKDILDSSLDEAEIIIGIGRGIGSKENLHLIYDFAKLFKHSAVAGSRIVCDYGWLPYSKQVGITGKSIAPKVYIACAISGSSQHVAGIKGAKTIIAINKDPYAPIFNVAHYGIVADIFEFIPMFIENVKNKN